MISTIQNDVPVAALIVDKYDNILTSSTNDCFAFDNPLRHAELLALDKALESNPHTLKECTIYISLEPCLMCYGAIVHSGIKKIVYLAKNLRDGAFSHHHVDIQNDNILANYYHVEQAERILSEFFAKRRKDRQ